MADGSNIPDIPLLQEWLDFSDGLERDGDLLKQPADDPLVLDLNGDGIGEYGAMDREISVGRGTVYPRRRLNDRHKTVVFHLQRRRIDHDKGRFYHDQGRYGLDRTG